MSSLGSPTASGGAGIALDLRALERWFADRDIPFVGRLSATRIGLGQSNLTYSIRDEGGNSWVARRPPLGHLLASAHDVAREHKILTALAGTDVPTPGVIGLVESTDVCDQPVLVVEFVPGLVVDRLEAAEAIPADRRHRVGLQLASVLARLHAVDVEAVGLSDLASHAPYAPRQLKRWTRQWEASRTRDLPNLDRLTQWLTEHVPQRSELTVVHGDLHLSNVILDPDDGTVRVALDWELSTLGDPLADLGTTLAYWPAANESTTFFSASRLPGFASRASVASAYAEATGRDLTDLTFWRAVGMWKVAIISEGVRRRAMDEPSNASQSGPPSIELVDEIVEAALDLVS